MLLLKSREQQVPVSNRRSASLFGVGRLYFIGMIRNAKSYKIAETDGATEIARHNFYLDALFRSRNSFIDPPNLSGTIAPVWSIPSTRLSGDPRKPSGISLTGKHPRKRRFLKSRDCEIPTILICAKPFNTMPVLP